MRPFSLQFLILYTIITLINIYNTQWVFFDMKLVNKIFGDPNEKTLKHIQPIVDEVNKHWEEFKNFSDDEIKEKTQSWKIRLLN